MYSEDRLGDLMRFGKAVLTNQLARLAPRLYLGLTGQTGRGSQPETPAQVAEYFSRCLAEYAAKLGVAETGLADYLAGKVVLEYGPGDVPGVALLMYAYGAERVTCVDRFPLMAWSQKNLAVIDALAAGLPPAQRKRLDQAFLVPGQPASGLRAGTLDYRITKSGLSRLQSSVDLIISRAVLEHVNDLDATFQDMFEALRPGGIALHQVDLKSHGLHRRNELDFLAWPPTAWSLMHSQKGVPNRWRVNRYREIIAHTAFELGLMEPTSIAAAETVREVRPHLAPGFATLSDEDLAWLGFWVLLRKPSLEPAAETGSTPN